jgi:hypothetical protein
MHNSKCILVTQIYMFRTASLPSPGVIYCTTGIGTFYAGLTTSYLQGQDGTDSILTLQARGRQTCIKCVNAGCTVDNS